MPSIDKSTPDADPANGAGNVSRIRSHSSESTTGRPRICLVTGEFHGLFKNGGIGTANTGLALALGAAGFEVVVAFVDSEAGNPKALKYDLTELKDRYRQLGVRLEMVPRHPLLLSGVDGHLANSYSVYAYLQARLFDVVFFNECGGQGYYSLLAKHTGLFRDPPLMCVVAHGSLAWVLEINGQLNWGLRPIAMNFVERRSVELADTLIAPSRYLIDWMAARGWALPKRVEMIQNLVPAPAEAMETAAAPCAITELAFFGRLEARKGLELFCDAIDRLAKERDLSRVSITFMGKFSKIGGMHSGVYLIERSRGWKTAPRIIVHYDQKEALDHLRRPGVLAVIPSLAENSPCVVAECLMSGVPFIATDSGGTAELVAEEDRAELLFRPNAEALRAKLASALDSGVRLGKMSAPQSETRARWLDLLGSFLDEARDGRAISRAASAFTDRPLVSICLVHEHASGADPRALSSVLAQTYGHFEIVVVEYGGGADEREDRGGESRSDTAAVRRCRAATADRGEARNAAAAKATGDWLLFVDETQVVLKPTCLEAFVGVAIRCGVDIVTGVPLEFEQSGTPNEGWDGQLNYFPLGADKELAAFENCLGHSVLLIRRRTFEAIGGFESGVNASIEDWLLLAKAVIAGGSLELAPSPLYWRRVSRSRAFDIQDRVDAQRRILRAYDDQKISSVRNALESVIVWSPQSRDFVMAALAGIGGMAKDLALELSFTYTPGDPDGFKAFVEYCVGRGRFREASEFATFCDPAKLLPIVRGAAEATAKKAALAAVTDVRRDYLNSIELTSLAAERVRIVSGQPNARLTRDSGGVAAHPTPLGLTVLKSPATLPPGTRSVEVVAEVEATMAGGAQIAVAVCTPQARMNFRDSQLVAPDGAWWSGWTRTGGGRGPVTVRVSLDRSVEQPLDIFLLSRIEDEVSTSGRLVWRSVSAEIAVLEVATPSAIAPELAASSLPRHFLDRAQLVTPAPDFPVPFFTPGEPTMHHPLVGRAAIVKLREAIFPGAGGVRAIVSVQNERAHPIDFALWARRTSEPASDEPSLAGSLGSSGWITVRVPFQQRQVTFDLRAPARESLDLYLATKVPEFPDCNWCHAAWHDIFVLEPMVASH